MLSQLPGKQQYFNITNGKLVYFFFDKMNLKMASEPFIFPRYARNFGEKTHFSTNTLYILHPYKQLTDHE